MKNVTITLDEETAAWARVYAAEHNTSVSRMLGELLAERRQQIGEYDRAMRAFLALPPLKINAGRKRYPPRDALHDRARLR